MGQPTVHKFGSWSHCLEKWFNAEANLGMVLNHD
jgi:hypothetical protein